MNNMRRDCQFNDANGVLRGSNFANHAVPTMIAALFHPDQNRDEFARLLETRLQFLQAADAKTVSEIDASLGKLPTPGRPVNANTLILFRCADAAYVDGTTLETAIECAMEQFPHIKPQPRRRRTKKITIRTQRSPDHDKEILLAEYKRYRGLIAAGLDPAIAYSTNNFFEFILTRQWQKAAAVFTKANKQRRAKLCSRLNLIGSKNAE